MLLLDIAIIWFTFRECSSILLRSSMRTVSRCNIDDQSIEVFADRVNSSILRFAFEAALPRDYKGKLGEFLILAKVREPNPSYFFNFFILCGPIALSIFNIEEGIIESDLFLIVKGTVFFVYIAVFITIALKLPKKWLGV